MKLQTAVNKISHTCTRDHFLAAAAELGLREPWTDEDVDAVRAIVRVNAGVAARMIGLRAPEFTGHAAELGFTAPYLHSEIREVRDKVTPDFPNMTSQQIAKRMNMGVGWIRRYARKHNIGEWVAGGAYMVDGERRRYPAKARSFSESDIQLFLDVFPAGATERRFPLSVAMDDYALACEVAAKTSPTTSPADVMSGWTKAGAAAARADG